MPGRRSARPGAVGVGMIADSSATRPGGAWTTRPRNPPTSPPRSPPTSAATSTAGPPPRRRRPRRGPARRHPLVTHQPAHRTATPELSLCAPALRPRGWVFSRKLAWEAEPLEDRGHHERGHLLHLGALQREHLKRLRQVAALLRIPAVGRVRRL